LKTWARVVRVAPSRPGGLSPARPLYTWGRPGRLCRSGPRGSRLGHSILLLFLLPLPLPGMQTGVRAQVLTLDALLSGLLAPETAHLRHESAGGPLRARLEPGASGAPVTDPLAWLESDRLPVAAWSYRLDIPWRTERGGRTRSDLTSEGRDIAVAAPLGTGRWRLLWGMTGTSDRSHGPLPGDRGFYDRYATLDRSWVGVRLSEDRWGLLAVAGAVGREFQQTEGALAVSWDAQEWLSLAVWGSRERGRDHLILGYRDVTASFPVQDRTDRIGVRMVLRRGGWAGRLRLERSDGGSQTPPTADHRLRPNSRLRLAEGTLSIPGGRISLRIGSSDGDFGADLDHSMVRYGRFRILDDRFWLRVEATPGLIPGTSETWAGWSRTRLDGEANVALWPFTPTVLDLLGGRRLALADGDVDLLSGGVRWSTVRPGLDLLLGADLHLAAVAGGTVSWEPQILGFGRRNVLVDRIDLEQALLIDLGGEMDVGITQLAPLWTRRRGGGGSGGGGGTGGDRTRPVWGGLRCMAGLVFRPSG